MLTISGLAKVLGKIPGMDLSDITETKVGWKSSLLSGRKGNDAVNLYIGKILNGKTVLISESYFSDHLGVKTVQEMINSNSISSGYPLYYIKEALGLKEAPPEIVYSLLYRSASIVLEAERLRIQNAVLIIEVPEFSKSANDYYKDFTSLFCSDYQPNCFHQSQLRGRVNFYFGFFNTKLNQIH